MKKRLLIFPLISILLLICIPLAGCNSEEGLAAEDIAQIVENVSTSEPDACTFDMDISGEMKISGDGQNLAINIIGGGKGSIDNFNEEMYMPIVINANVPGFGNQTMSMKAYIVDGWMYMYMDGEWTKTELTPEMWEQQTQIGQLTDLLEFADIEDKGTENVNGVDCYKFQITPDLAEMAEYVFQQPGMEMDGFDLSGLEEILSSFNVNCTFWISEEDNLVMQVECYVGGELSSEDIPGMEDSGFDSIDLSMDMTMTITFDYDESVDIELPHEAKDAYDIGTHEIYSDSDESVTLVPWI